MGSMQKLRVGLRLSAFFCAVALQTYGAYGETARVDSATKAQLKTATENYERGVSAMDAEQYPEALKAFQASYDTVSSPNSSLMIGRVLLKMGKYIEAYRELERTLKQSTELAATQKKYRKTADSAEKELFELKKQLAFIRVKAGTQLVIQGVATNLSEWQTLVPLTPGIVTVEVITTTGKTTSKTIPIKAGETVDYVLDHDQTATPGTNPVVTPSSPQSTLLPTTKESTINRRTVGYVVGGFGLVGVGLFVGFGLLGTSSYGDVKSDCAAGSCPEDAVDNSGSKSLRQGIGYSGLAMGVLGLGIGTWLVLSGGKTTSTTAINLSPSGIALSRRF
jgi:hypothetical protein